MLGAEEGGGGQKIYFAFVFGSVVKLCSISFYNKKRKVAQFFFLLLCNMVVCSTTVRNTEDQKNKK